MIEPLLRKAFEASDDTVTFDGVVRDIMAKNRQLWVAGNEGEDICAVAVTSLQQCESGLKQASITLLGGDYGNLVELLKLRSELEAWAKVEGCTRFRIYGRRGWARRLLDYDLKICVLSKDL